MMDIETGVFTVLTSGYYILTYSGNADVDHDESTQMYITLNGHTLRETVWETSLKHGSGTSMYDSGSRTTVSRTHFLCCRKSGMEGNRV